MNITDDLKKKDDKKVWESYLGSLNKSKLVLEPIPEDLVPTTLRIAPYSLSIAFETSKR